MCPRRKRPRWERPSRPPSAAGRPQRPSAAISSPLASTAVIAAAPAAASCEKGDAGSGSVREWKPYLPGDVGTESEGPYEAAPAPAPPGARLASAGFRIHTHRVVHAADDGSVTIGSPPFSGLAVTPRALAYPRLCPEHRVSLYPYEQDHAGLL
eukprot:GHVU01095879.1.p1 GENE.GHVU01095879.1~~GHVU01095879.1.p1  ORF type:complete len:154 (-),score=10.75 GHVU01095879.1:163-624(-)